ncbi:hypothetical protein [Lacinutrix sp.]|uniref:hypothetical protein n=1 Tax=Lacinutrix sp. TaxID=1937692 RepID=UPI0025C6CF37|nr:hypothetical protein [Lacinutrix sp.]
MENKIQHIVIKSIIILLVAAIVLPSVVKFTHVFEEHKHEVCANPSDSHYHEVEIDCEFYKFKVNNPYTLVFENIYIFNNLNNYSNFYSRYTFLKSFKNFGIALRGPPKSFSFSC